MKKIHIALLVLIAAGIAAILSMSPEGFSSYETFRSASEQPEKTFKVVGFLAPNHDITYDPVKDPNHFTFFAKDKSGAVTEVICNKEKPRDFEKSEQVVMTGHMEAGVFRCSDIQLKCPSKYTKKLEVEGKKG